MRAMSRSTLSTALILFVIFTSDFSSSKKVRSLGLDGRSDKLNDCGRCKVLTESFNYWMQKTSRGKYEGGDAAWEESKLKAYARSEVRLVEIQESLCSELSQHQDNCYALSEETEQVIEKWWFQEDHNSADMYTWLCIETLKQCCPVNHFGDVCTPCVLVNNKICNGNGKCDGEGTRQGNGTCICKRGFKGNNCEQCVENYFSTNDGSCKKCHHACSGCSSEGPSACNVCKSGWKLEAGVCVDINECLSKSSCNINELCINREGSFKCKPCDSSCKTCGGPGAKNCTSCELPFVLWSGMCISRKQHDEIVFTTLKKLVLYTGLIVIATFIHMKYFRSVLYIFFILLGILVYYTEPAQMHLLEVMQNIYLNSNLHIAINDIINNIVKCFNNK